MNLETDFIDMIHVEKLSVQAEPIKEEGEKLCSELGVKNHTFTTLPYNPDQDREDTILDHVHKEETPYIDFFVVSNKGTGFAKHKSSRYLGHVAKGLL